MSSNIGYMHTKTPPKSYDYYNNQNSKYSRYGWMIVFTSIHKYTINNISVIRNWGEFFAVCNLYLIAYLWYYMKFIRTCFNAYISYTSKFTYVLPYQSHRFYFAIFAHFLFLFFFFQALLCAFIFAMTK